MCGGSCGEGGWGEGGQVCSVPAPARSGLMLFPPGPQPLNRKTETDASHPGLHTGAIQRNYFKTPNPGSIRDHSVKSPWPGLSIRKDYPLKRCPGRTLLKMSGLPLPIQPPGCSGSCLGWRFHRAQRRASMGLQHLLSSALCRGSSLGTSLPALSESGREKLMFTKPAVCWGNPVFHCQQSGVYLRSNIPGIEIP